MQILAVDLPEGHGAHRASFDVTPFPRVHRVAGPAALIGAAGASTAEMEPALTWLTYFTLFGQASGLMLPTISNLPLPLG